MVGSPLPSQLKWMIGSSSERLWDPWDTLLEIILKLTPEYQVILDTFIALCLFFLPLI